MGVLSWVIGGLIVGLLAQFFVSSPRSLGCIGTVVLGIIGSVVGGTLINVLRGDGVEFAATGFWGSIFGAIVLLVLARLFNRGSVETPR
jgi:uncharacterized membrane protein YeaQ/YmgE (transglycosylase-associated protein family)